MSEKLRECPFCGEKELLFSLVDYNTKNGHTGCRSCGLSVTQSTIFDSERRWNTRYNPKHETVEQWEKRTGETYPDESMTWAWIQGDCHSGDEWILMEYCNAKDTVDFKEFQIVVCENPTYIPEEL